MSYDNLAKTLSEKYPERFATWLLGSPQNNVEVLKTELSIEPIVAVEVGKIESVSERQEIAICVNVMAGLRFSKRLVQSLFQEDVIQESVTYQDILKKGEDKGLRAGLQQGLQQGLQREVDLVCRLLIRKVGSLPVDIRSTLHTLPIEQIESLGEDLLSFEGLADLENWLARSR